MDTTEIVRTSDRVDHVSNVSPQTRLLRMDNAHDRGPGSPSKVSARDTWWDVTRKSADTTGALVRA
eukprot:m.200877 g.200877  ORF g.200877 m.200877 type:complete len:66 (+) comp18795_c0_seq27:180-377(+)